MLQLRCVLFSSIVILCSCNSSNNQEVLIQKTLLAKTNTKATLIEKDSGTVKERKEEKYRIDRKLNRESKPSILKSAPLYRALLIDEFESLNRGYQIFHINAGIDTLIVCNGGTTIHIKPNSFIDTNLKNDVKDTITFRVREFYKISDIILGRLSTNSNENILETGGMLFIEALANGHLCQLKKTTPIEIAFPFEKKKDSMLLFSGNWLNDKINWQQTGVQLTNREKDIEEKAMFPGGEVALNEFFRTHLLYPDSLANRAISCIVQMGLVIDETGKIEEIIFKNSVQNGFKEAVLTAFSKIPRWKPAKRNGVSVKSVYLQNITFSSQGNGSDSAFKKEFESVNDTFSMSNVEIRDIQRYVFSCSELGWINCDRFYNSSKPKVNFRINCGSYNEVDIKLVFHTFKAILGNYSSGKLCSFKSVPTDEAITVVVVKKVNDETFISSTESNTSFKSISNLTFEKVTMEKLKQKLEQLNTLN